MTTPYTYAAPIDVINHLLVDSHSPVTEDTPITKGQIAGYINRAEDEHDDRRGVAFRPRWREHEIHDMEAWRQRHRELFTNWFAVPRPVQLDRKPIIQLDSSKDHKIEVYEGSTDNISDTAPHGEWTNYLDKTQGREHDWWVNWREGKLFTRKTFLFRRASLLRITYEWGKPITTLSSSITDSDTTINVTSTHRYERRGFIRLGDEWIFHTGKTDTSFTGCQRGVRETEQNSHSSGDEVYEVPENVWQKVVKKAAADFLENEVYQGVVGEGAGGTPAAEKKIQTWNEEWKEFLGQTKQKWGLL